MRTIGAVALFVACAATSCNGGGSELTWAVKGDHTGVFSKVFDINCMYGGPNALAPERYISVDVFPKKHPDVATITALIRPMPDEQYGTRAVRTSPNLGTYWHHGEEYVDGAGDIPFFRDVEMRVELSLGEESFFGGVTEREVLIHNLVIPRQTVGLPDSAETFELEGRLTDVRLWCVTDKI